MYNEEQLRNRLNSFLSIYSITSKYDFPRRIVMLRFGSISFESKTELGGRIKEICDLLKINIEDTIKSENLKLMEAKNGS